MSQHHKFGAEKRKERNQHEENTKIGLQTLFQVGVKKSTTFDALFCRQILDEVASEGTAIEVSSSD